MFVLCRDGQCPEYSGEEQAICAVGLAKTRPGVFIQAIQHIIVLATPVEVSIFVNRLLGVIYTRRLKLLRFLVSTSTLRMLV